MERERYDQLEAYCRMLGHGVRFSYCRIAKTGLPCHRVLDCWFERIPVQEYMTACYSAREREAVFKPPGNRVATLIDLIRQAQERQKS